MADETTFAPVVAATIDGWSRAFVAREVYGTQDPVAIVRQVNAFCRRALGATIAAYLFYEESVGSVSGVVLDDGRRVVVKAHPPTVESGRLVASQRVQAHLAEQGFPCPRPILGPTPLAKGVAVAEELLDDGLYRDAHDPPVRRAMAERLAQLVAVAQPFVDLPGLRAADAPRDALWPRPHSKLFDFEATAAGVEWIDDLARAARQTLAVAEGRRVVGHMDWAVKHFRFDGDAVRVIYDWDSLAVERETRIVGAAAHSFTMTWQLPVRVIPSKEEALAFVAEYEAARGRPFDVDERATMAAAATDSLAYSARCEHCLDPRARDYPPGSAREALALHGLEFLRSSA